MAVNIRIAPRILERMFKYADLCPTEIMGFGSVNPISGCIDSLFPLFEQTAGAADVEVGDEVMYKIANSNYSHKIQVFWHSHVNMSVFWSQTDEQAIRDLGIGCPWLISIVVNKKREYKCRVDWFKPITAKIDDCNLVTQYNLDSETTLKMKSEVEDMVKPHQVKVLPVIGSESRHFGYHPRGGRTYQDSFPFEGQDAGGLPEFMMGDYDIINGVLIRKKERKDIGDGGGD